VVSALWSDEWRILLIAFPITRKGQDSSANESPSIYDSRRRTRVAAGGGCSTKGYLYGVLHENRIGYSCRHIRQTAARALQFVSALESSFKFVFPCLDWPTRPQGKRQRKVFVSYYAEPAILCVRDPYRPRTTKASRK
jgi:hypothetical protein